MANEANEFMRSIDRSYRDRSGLSERRFYSIFYSLIAPSPVLVLGYNPGGDPNRWDSTEFAAPLAFENGEHEYLRYDYPLARAMRDYLIRSLSLSDPSKIGGIPKTNLIFRRSTGQDTLELTAGEALTEAKPYVEKIIERVSPMAIVLEGKTTHDHFRSLYCSDVSPRDDGAPVTTPNGKHRALIYQREEVFVDCLNRRVMLLGIGHPSRYAGRAEWLEVIERSKRAFAVADIRV